MSAAAPGGSVTAAPGSRLAPLVTWARAGARRTLDALDRRMHAMRRTSARRAVRNIQGASRVLVLCYGNVCRSPFAAAALTRRLTASGGPQLLVESAGFIGPGRNPPRGAVDSGARRGYDLALHRSAVVEPEQVREASLIVVMSADQADRVRELFRTRAPIVLLGDLDPEAIRTRTITDPWDGGPADFDASYDRIERCVESLVHELVQGRRTDLAPLVVRSS